MKNPFARKKVRYAVVSAGHITQFAFLPAVEATKNSVVTTVVTGDMEKARFLRKKYDIDHSCGYDGYDDLLTSGLIDAVYIAAPNDRHKEFTVKALKAGIHVLLEKPMSIDEKECLDMIKAGDKSKAKLMIAYRLHFEPATHATLKIIRDGKIGKPHMFSSTFAQFVDPENHRAQEGFWAGPVADLGAYPINAVRNLFEDEPVEIHAFSATTRSLLWCPNETVSVTMKFPEERLAQFTVSYGAPHSIDSFEIAGDKGVIELKTAYGYGSPKTQVVTIGKKVSEKEFAPTNQFGGELQYFSDCVLQDKTPEPDGEEGYCDTRVIAAIKKSLDTGKPVKLKPYKRKNVITKDQEKKLAPIKPPSDKEMKNVKAPGKR